MMRTLVRERKHAVFILPFVSIVEEKASALQPFADSLGLIVVVVTLVLISAGFAVEIYAGYRGRVPPIVKRKHVVLSALFATDSSRGQPVLYVATIEKAHSLLSNLIEEKRICRCAAALLLAPHSTASIGCIVADELHLMGEGRRGAILEVLMTKVCCVNVRLFAWPWYAGAHGWPGHQADWHECDHPQPAASG
jgi:hypothetical protein